MKKFKLNKKILFASVVGIFGVAGIAAVAAACTNDKGSTENNSGNNATNNNTGGNTGTQSSLSVNEFFAKSKTENASDYHNAYRGLIEEGARHLGLIGFTNEAPLNSALKAGNVLKENATASLIDNKFYGETGGDRVSSVSFKTDQAGFLAGVAAAYYLNANQDKFAKDGGTLKWGGFVGDNYSSTTSFIQGFSVGVMWANEKLASKEVPQEGSDVKKTWINVEQATTTSGLITGDFSPSNPKAGEITNQLITAKANIILPVAGPQTGPVTQIVKSSKQPAVVIGVDSAQELSDLNHNRENDQEINNGKTILFSIIKRVDLAVKETARKAQEGAELVRKENDMYPDSYKLGTHTVADLNEGTKVNGEYLVGVSKPAEQNLLNAVKLANESSSATDYASAIKELVQEEAFALLSEDKSSSWDTYLDAPATKGAARAIKSTVTERGLSLQKLLGGNAFVYGNQVYSYSFEKSSYLVKEGNGSTAFKKYWEDNKNNKSALEKAVKIVLGNPSSVLRDKSFSQSAYEGLVEFYKANGIAIPKL